MALTIGEAQAVNDLLRFALDGAPAADVDDVTYDRLRSAGILLADHAHKPLMAGLTGADVAASWPELDDDAAPPVRPKPWIDGSGVRVAEDKVADRIVTMLARRSRGELTADADDFISGLITAYGLVAGIHDDARQVNVDVAYESAAARGTEEA
jgi:hypothetical protein